MLFIVIIITSIKWRKQGLKFQPFIVPQLADMFSLILANSEYIQKLKNDFITHLWELSESERKSPNIEKGFVKFAVLLKELIWNT